MRPPFHPVRLTPLVCLADAALRRMVRWEVDDPDGLLDQARAGRSFVFACRHGQLWPLLWAVGDCGVTILASRSSDGELLTRVLRRRGFGVIRGSSSKDGTAAAREALRLLRAGGRLGLAVDGPRGPRGIVQEGVLRLAQRSGSAIVPLRVRGGRPWIAPGSWDAFEIPRPRCPLTVRVGPVIEVGGNDEDRGFSAERLAEALAVRLPAPAGPSANGVRRSLPVPAERG